VKKVLGVVGSPRRGGNTDILVSRMLEGAGEEGARTEALFLADLRIEECHGCHACWAGKVCPRDDDMIDVYPRIIESDVIIFGTPVYWYGPTALMKGFIDRFVYFNCPENRAKIRNKPAAIAICLEEDNPETASLLVEFFEKCLDYLEMNLAGKIIVPGVTKKGEIRKKDDRLGEAWEMGRALGRQ
jgi:multimeric flavodoxin WrbA